MIGFFMAAAAQAVTVETPVEGQTGVWLSSGGAAVSSGMSIAGGIIRYQTSVTAADVYSRGVLAGASVGYWGNLYVHSGGLATDTVVYMNGANAYARAGVLSDTTITAGRFYIQSGGTAAGAVVSGGSLVVQSGSASAVIVNEGGTLVVSSGGTALAVTSNAGAVVNSSAGAYIEYA